MSQSSSRGAKRAALGICASALALLVVSSSAADAVRKVPQKYPTIQAAVDAANPGDRIAISKRRNFEHVTVSTPRLVIKGARKGVVVDGYIEGTGNGYQFAINANRVRLANLELRSGYGVDCGSSNRCVIARTLISGTAGTACAYFSGDRSELRRTRLVACGSEAVVISGNRARVVNSRVSQTTAHRDPR